MADDDRRTPNELVALVGLAILAGVYFVLRPGSLWAETDSGLMAQAIRVVMNRAQLAPITPDAYYNGFGYQAVAMAIVTYTGVSIQTLQQEIFPVVSALLVLPAWALYRELTGSARIATLAVLVLLLVPEHLFAVLRGSHERLDRAFLMTALWLLIRSTRVRSEPRQYIAHVALVLVMTWGLIATNALFGMSLVAALLTALVLSWLARLLVPGLRDVATKSIRLLGWTSAASALLLFIFVVFVYPPILPTLREIGAIPESLINLVLQGGGGFDPYAGILAAWVSPTAYLLLSLTDFVVLGASAIFWLWLGWRWLRGGRPESLGVWMLWLFFAAFAAQGAASILSDRTGSLAANVQYRAFAVFAALAAPMVALALSRWPPGPRLVRLAVAGVAAVVVAGASVGALVKSTLDPTVSNKWIFYTAPELEGIVWVTSRWPGMRLWVGPDDRLIAAYEMVVGGLSHADVWDLQDPEPDTQFFMVSEAIREQSQRVDEAMPPLASTNLVYDNGEVQVDRLRASPPPS
ncbi:MAG: hypothetical protein E6K80_13505 [Candidatus Eisenbacteria bacterium]|uniref:Glycosyltransferase RgtA/B/C/D-like domain-containing protein n=1 Tax=Eiseniibacteriota bacterium TaxID=2212470 RepID=A0A538TZ07_UNCEI|nr:MAG: hypothetical protein E6K80_13505 [Candidatus Eisenbacteria bacterium]